MGRTQAGGEWSRLPVLGGVGLFSAVILFFLSQPGSPSTIETRFVPLREQWPRVFVPLVRGEAGGGKALYRLALFAPRLDALLDHPEVKIQLVAGDIPGARSWWQRLWGPRLLAAQLRVFGTPCTYEAREGGELSAAGALILFRGEGCSASVRASGPLALTLTVRGRAEIALDAFVPPPTGAVPAFIHVGASPDGATTRPILNGAYLEHPPGAELARIALLNYLWQISDGLGWMWGLLAVATVLAAAGLLLFPSAALGSGEPRPPRRVIRGAGAAACLAGSLGMLHSVLQPPLYTPDEPYHLLAYGALIGDPPLEAQIREWMRRTHLVRLRFSAQRFRPVDIGQPYTREEDPFVGTPDVRARSATAAVLWAATGSWLKGQPVPRRLLWFRLVNAGLFALTVGGVTALAIAVAPVPFPELLCFPFLFIPPMPMLATHFSEVAAVCPAYLLVAAGLALLFIDGERAHWAGWALGLGTGLMLAGGRAGWPLLVLIAIALAVRLLLGPRGADRLAMRSVLLWLGLGVGWLVFCLLLTAPYAEMLRQFAPKAPLGTGRLQDWLMGRPWLLLALLPPVVALDVSLGGVRQAVIARLRGNAPPMAAAVATAAGGAIVLSLLGSLFVTYPNLPDVPVPNTYTAGQYARQALVTGLTVFRLTEPDFHMFSSFWATFGWLDTVLPLACLTSLTLANAACTVGLLLHLARGRDFRRLAVLGALTVGWTLSLLTYALSIHTLPMNLSGRYLIGWHLSLAAVLWTWPALAPPRLAEGRRLRFGVPRPALLLLLTGAVQAFSLCYVLWRYF